MSNPSFRVNPVPASRLHRHQSSLEGWPTPTEPLEPKQRAEATRFFNQIIDHCERSQIASGPYNRVTLIRLTYKYALSEISQDGFLKHFFQYMAIPMEEEYHYNTWDAERKSEIVTCVAAFADYLIDNFFLPLKASTRKTPQPTPASLTDIQTTQQVVGTTQRISVLRRDCLIRDRRRCVVSRKFDWKEAMERAKRDGDNAKDDDGNLLNNELEEPDYLEVAHILPHSLMTSGQSANEQTELNDSKKTALTILDMFDHGVVHLINGSHVDRPTNALTLTSSLHQRFGNFEIYFEPTQGVETPHTYTIHQTESFGFQRTRFPITRTLYLTEDRNIDPPSPRLLAVHRAIALILHLSAAGEYIDQILRDLEEVDIEKDGSTELGRLMELRLGGWWDGVVRVY